MITFYPFLPKNGISFDIINAFVTNLRNKSIKISIAKKIAFNYLMISEVLMILKYSQICDRKAVTIYIHTAKL